MTVITPDGLVGNIHEAYASYSEVELITDLALLLVLLFNVLILE